VQCRQGVDKAEPADEPFVRAPFRAKPSVYRLGVEVQVELHAQRAVLVGGGSVIHRGRPYARLPASASGGSPIQVPDLAPVSAWPSCPRPEMSSLR
jgi:hypothetical protein